jgi:hypothetical protein
MGEIEKDTRDMGPADDFNVKTVTFKQSGGEVLKGDIVFCTLLMMSY